MYSFLLKKNDFQDIYNEIQEVKTHLIKNFNLQKTTNPGIDPIALLQIIFPFYSNIGISNYANIKVNPAYIFGHNYFYKNKNYTKIDLENVKLTKDNATGLILGTDYDNFENNIIFASEGKNRIEVYQFFNELITYKIQKLNLITLNNFTIFKFIIGKKIHFFSYYNGTYQILLYPTKTINILKKLNINDYPFFIINFEEQKDLNKFSYFNELNPILGSKSDLDSFFIENVLNLCCVENTLTELKSLIEKSKTISNNKLINYKDKLDDKFINLSKLENNFNVSDLLSYKNNYYFF